MTFKFSFPPLSSYNDHTHYFLCCSCQNIRGKGGSFDYAFQVFQMLLQDWWLWTGAICYPGIPPSNWMESQSFADVLSCFSLQKLLHRERDKWSEKIKARANVCMKKTHPHTQNPPCQQITWKLYFTSWKCNFDRVSGLFTRTSNIGEHLQANLSNILSLCRPCCRRLLSLASGFKESLSD